MIKLFSENWILPMFVLVVVVIYVGTAMVFYSRT